MRFLLACFLVCALAELAPAQVACNGKTPTLIGTTGDDVLIGSAGRDIIHGLAGDDLIKGYGGDDWLCGGPGDDVLVGGTGNDLLKGQNGFDTFDCGAGSDNAHNEGAEVVPANCEKHF